MKHRASWPEVILSPCVLYTITIDLLHTRPVGGSIGLKRGSARMDKDERTTEQIIGERTTQTPKQSDILYSRYSFVMLPGCSRQRDIAFALDLSGSTDSVYAISLALTTEVVKGLPIRFDRARVGLVSYADRATINFYLNTYQTKEDILNAIAFR